MEIGAIEQMVKTLTSLSQEGGSPYILYIYIYMQMHGFFFLVTGGQIKVVTDQGFTGSDVRGGSFF